MRCENDRELRELLHVFLVLAAAPQLRTLGLMRTEEGSRVPRRGRDDGPLVSVTDGRKGLTFSPPPNAIASPRVLRSSRCGEEWRREVSEWEGIRQKKNMCGFALLKSAPTGLCVCRVRPICGLDAWAKNILRSRIRPPVLHGKQWKRRSLENLSKSYVRLLSGQIFVVPGWSTQSGSFSRCSLNL